MVSSTRPSPLLVNMYPVLLVPLPTPQYGCFVPNVDRLHTVLTLLLRFFVSSHLPICVPPITSYHPHSPHPLLETLLETRTGGTQLNPKHPRHRRRRLVERPCLRPGVRSESDSCVDRLFRCVNRFLRYVSGSDSSTHAHSASCEPIILVLYTL